MLRGWVRLLFAAMLVTGCATLTPAEQAAVVRGTPVLEQLLGAPLPQLPQRGAVALALADGALVAGNALRASELIGQAVQGLDPAAISCATHGSLWYLQGLLASKAGAAASDHGWDSLATQCVEAEVAGAEAAFQTFFAFLTTAPGPSTGAHDGSASGTYDPPSKVREARRQEAMLAAADTLPTAQGQILRTYARWLEQTTREPAGRCDTGFDKSQRAGLRAAAQAVMEAGRPDLVTRYFTLVAVSGTGEVNTDLLDQLADFSSVPAHRYLRREAVGGALAAIALAGDYVSPLVTAPMCEQFYGDLLEEVGNDRAPGFDGRNAARLMAAFGSANACLGQHDLVALVDGAFAASLAQGSKHFGVLKLSGGVLVSLGLQLFTGGTHAGLSLGHLSGALARVQQGLGSGPEDRALSVTIDVILALPGLLSGQTAELMAALAGATEVLDDVLAAPRGTEPSEFMAWLPVLRLGCRALLAGLVVLVDDPGAVTDELTALRRHLPDDLQALFAVAELKDHSQALMTLLDAVVIVLSEVDKGNLDSSALTAAMTSLSEPGVDEAGWWALGLDVLRLVALDATALQVHADDPAASLFPRALAQAELVAERIVDHAVSQFELSGTMARLLHLLPAIHRAVPALLDDGLSGEALALAVGRALQEPLARVSESIKASGPASGGSQVGALVAELLVAAGQVGLEPLLTDPQAALARAVYLLEDRLGNYPPDIRLFLELVVAVGQSYADHGHPAESFARAAAAAKESLPEVAFVPILLEAALKLAADAPIQDILALADRALAHGFAATRCGQTHAVHSILPARMWLREAAGDHAGAADDYQTFLRLVEGGFQGDVMVRCRLRSYADTVIFSVDLANSTAAFLLPGKNEGTFNVGLGTETGRSGQGAFDELDCEALYAGGPRFDRIMEAHLAFGVMALIHGDVATAQAVLGKAIATGRQMTHGTLATMGRNRARGAQEGARKVSLEMVAYAALLARLNGLGQQAERLLELGHVFASVQDKSWLDVAGPDHEVPIMFQRIPGLAGFDDLVTRWQAVRTGRDRTALAKALVAFAKTGTAYPAWGVPLALEALEERLPAPERKPLLKALVPARSAAGTVAEPLYQWRNVLVGAGQNGALPPVTEIAGVARELARRGLYWELAAPLGRMVLFAWRQKDPDTAFALVELALELIDGKVAPVPYLDTVILTSDLLLEVDNRDKAVEALILAGNAFDGYQPEQEEIQLLYRLLQLAGPSGDGELVWGVVNKLAPMVHASMGPDSLAFYTLVALDTAFRQLVDQAVSDAAIRRFAEHGRLVPDGKDTHHYFQLLASTGDPVVRKDLSKQFLGYILQNGPLPAMPKPQSP